MNQTQSGHLGLSGWLHTTLLGSVPGLSSLRSYSVRLTCGSVTSWDACRDFLVRKVMRWHLPELQQRLASPFCSGRKREKRATHARATDVRLLHYYNFYPSFRKRIREHSKCVWKISFPESFSVCYLVHFLVILIHFCWPCATTTSVCCCVLLFVCDRCDSSVCGCFRGFSFFGFFLLLGRILFF